MAKTHTDEPAAASKQEAKAQRKKQARREARLMLKVEQARQSQQKAERKLARAQSVLERRKARVQKFEEKLAQARSAREAQNGSGPVISAQPQEQPAAERAPAAPQEPRETGTRTYEAALPPAEGRVDILMGDLAPLASSQEDGGDLEAIIAMREESTPPAEGRADILENGQEAATASQDPGTASEEAPAVPPEKDPDAITEEMAQSIMDEISDSAVLAQPGATSGESAPEPTNETPVLEEGSSEFHLETADSETGESVEQEGEEAATEPEVSSEAETSSEAEEPPQSE